MPTTADFRFPEFQQRFSHLRGDRTQAEFADFLDLSRPTVGLYESGQRIPDAKVLKRIAEKCGVSADFLLGLTTVESSSLSIRQICDLTGLSELTARTLVEDMASRNDKKRASFPAAFVDILFSEEDEGALLKAESAMIQAAVVQHFNETQSSGVLDFSPEELRSLLVQRASANLHILIEKALNNCVDYLVHELEREQEELIKHGVRPDGDFQELAYGKVITDSDAEEANNG